MKTKSISIAVGAIVYLLAYTLIRGIQYLYSTAYLPEGIYISLAITLLLLFGIIKGNRLAWQWGRLVSLFSALSLIVLLLGLTSPAQLQEQGAIYQFFLAIQILVLFVIYFSLGTKEARAHFRLICPGCSEAKARAGDLLFKKAICRKCGREW